MINFLGKRNPENDPEAEAVDLVAERLRNPDGEIPVGRPNRGFAVAEARIALARGDADEPTTPTHRTRPRQVRRADRGWRHTQPLHRTGYAAPVPALPPIPELLAPQHLRRSSASAEGSARMTRMTSAAAPDLRSTPVNEPTGPVVWYLAECHRCGLDLAQPFRNEVERDQWAIEHAEGAGHIVHLAVRAGRPNPTHASALIRRFSMNDWKWLCPTGTCAWTPSVTPKWNGPYATGQLALASWRAHRKTQ